MSAYGAVTVQQQRADQLQKQVLADEAHHRTDESLRRGDLNTANAELQRASALVIDGRFDQQERQQQLTDSLELAHKLDAVRGEYFTWSNGWFNCYTALDRYRVDFADAGWPMLDDEPTELVKRIEASPVANRIVAAIDDWAWLAHRESLRAPDETERQRYIDDRNRLLEISRLAGSDSDLKRELRNPQLWDQPEALVAVAKNVDPMDASPELLVLIGKLLPASEQFDFWKRCQAYHPEDFWFNIELGRSLLEQATADIPVDDPFGTNPVTRAFSSEKAVVSAERRTNASLSVGYYRAALTANPTRIGVHLDLAAALALSGDMDGAAELTRATSLIPPSPQTPAHEIAAAQHQRGLALRKLGDLNAAVENFRLALEADDTYVIARWDLAMTLKKLNRRVEAHKELEQLKRDNPENADLAITDGSHAESLN